MRVEQDTPRSNVGDDSDDDATWDYPPEDNDELAMLAKHADGRASDSDDSTKRILANMKK